MASIFSFAINVATFLSCSATNEFVISCCNDVIAGASKSLLDPFAIFSTKAAGMSSGIFFIDGTILTALASFDASAIFKLIPSMNSPYLLKTSVCIDPILEISL